MTKAEVTTASIEQKQFFRGTFAEDATPVRFGFGGLRSPIEWTLTVTDTTTNGKGRKSYHLHLAAQNRHPLGRLYGNFGYPTAIKNDQSEQGYDAAGFIKDVPKEILDAVEEVTGVFLTVLV